MHAAGLVKLDASVAEEASRQWRAAPRAGRLAPQAVTSLMAGARERARAAFPRSDHSSSALARNSMPEESAAPSPAFAPDGHAEHMRQGGELALGAAHLPAWVSRLLLRGAPRGLTSRAASGPVRGSMEEDPAGPPGLMMITHHSSTSLGSRDLHGAPENLAGPSQSHQSLHMPGMTKEHSSNSLLHDPHAHVGPLELPPDGSVKPAASSPQQPSSKGHEPNRSSIQGQGSESWSAGSPFTTVAERTYASLSSAERMNLGNPTGAEPEAAWNPASSAVPGAGNGPAQPPRPLRQSGGRVGQEHVGPANWSTPVAAGLGEDRADSFPAVHGSGDSRDEREAPLHWQSVAQLLSSDGALGGSHPESRGGHGGLAHGTGGAQSDAGVGRTAGGTRQDVGDKDAGTRGSVREEADAGKEGEHGVLLPAGGEERVDALQGLLAFPQQAMLAIPNLLPSLVPGWDQILGRVKQFSSLLPSCPRAVAQRRALHDLPAFQLPKQTNRLALVFDPLSDDVSPRTLSLNVPIPCLMRAHSIVSLSPPLGRARPAFKDAPM